MVNAESEDASSIAQHIACMKAEMKKVSPDHSLLSDRMQRTFSSRRTFILENTLTDVLSEYPALTLDSMVCTFWFSR